MKWAKLGRSGLVVSRLCLGTLNFGLNTSEADSFSIMDRAHELEINFFDTANSYGTVRGEGETETIIGRWFAQGGGRRERTVLGAKIYGRWGTWPNEGGHSALAIRRACDASLRRLQCDYIDLLQLHHLDETVPWEEIWEALSLLQQQGKVIYFGASNFASWNILAAQQEARSRHMMGLVSHQCLYNLLKRDAEREVIPAVVDQGMAVLAWSPLHRGMLTGVLQGRPPGGRFADTAVEEYRAQLEPFEALCAELGLQPAQVALAWLLARREVTCTVLGPQSVEHLEGSNAALDARFPEDAIRALDGIFPGPRKRLDDYHRPD